MIEQRTDEWYAQRVGKVTASRIHDVVAKTKTGWGASRANYMAELIAERLTGKPAERYQNKEMLWGIETEEQARALYEFRNDVQVELVGFVDHPRIAMSGASPDGRVGNGKVEIKCPNTATHIDTLLSGSVANKYVLQMQWQLACDGGDWNDYVSYDPRLPPGLDYWSKRFERDDKLILSLEQDVADFIGELETKLEALKRIAA